MGRVGLKQGTVEGEGITERHWRDGRKKRRRGGSGERGGEEEQRAGEVGQSVGRSAPLPR